MFEIAVVLVLEPIEDEQTLSNFTFMKYKLRNRLSLHLDTVVRMFAQEFYIQENFPYEGDYYSLEGLESPNWWCSLTSFVLFTTPNSSVPVSTI